MVPRPSNDLVLRRKNATPPSPPPRRELDGDEASGGGSSTSLDRNGQTGGHGATRILRRAPPS